jgi:arylsulfatase A-like enzyme
VHSEAVGKKNVLLVCVDTLRADRLGAYGYKRLPTSPEIDQLASESIVFEDASAPASWTKPSVPSFLTGTYPLQHGVYEGSARAAEGTVSDVLPETATTLAELFARAGYQTAAFVENAQLRKGMGFEQGFGDQYIDDAGDAREIRWRALDWLDERGDAGRPFFVYLHILDVHWPYDVPDNAAQRFASGPEVEAFRGEDSRVLRDAVNDGTRTLDQREREVVNDLYDGAVRYVDGELGRLRRALVERGLWDNTIVCLVADHGEEFLEHGRIGHGHGLWENLLRVPFILRIPRERPRRVSTPVSLVDLAPTLCSAADIAAERFEGIDRLRESDAPRAQFAEHKDPDNYLQSFRKGEYKLVRHFKPSDRAAREVPVDALQPRTRWEVECDLASDGSLHASSLSPRADPISDPMEVKGEVRELQGSTFRLAGTVVRVEPDCEFYGEMKESDARGAMLVEGLGIKVRGHFDGRVLVAEKIKLYSAGKPVPPEIRATLDRLDTVDGATWLTFGELRVRVDSDTDWKDDAGNLSREHIDQIATWGAREASEHGFVVEERLFHVGRDPGELTPVADIELARELSREMDEFVRGVRGRRVFAGHRSKPLDEREVQDLRALGYVK